MSLHIFYVEFYTTSLIRLNLHMYTKKNKLFSLNLYISKRYDNQLVKINLNYEITCTM